MASTSKRAECKCGRAMQLIRASDQAMVWACQGCYKVWFEAVGEDGWIQCEEHDYSPDNQKGRRVCTECQNEMDCFCNQPMVWSCYRCGSYYLPDAPEGDRWISMQRLAGVEADEPEADEAADKQESEDHSEDLDQASVPEEPQKQQGNLF